ncbi:MAG TPA: addiction module protein [Tepidisphaeraceae bacterium]|nr:addiction module protein [Tepidisphaeraceae bacterium]
MSSVLTEAQAKAARLDKKTIVEAALALPAEERAEVADEIALSLDEKYLSDIEALQLAEVQRRIANRDESKMIPLEEAMKMAEAREKP